MKLSEIGYSFTNLRKKNGPSVKVNDLCLPCHKMVDTCRAADSTFCQETVVSGILTESQMRHAAERYRLGKSRSGKCIFWMINEQGAVLDGRIDSPSVTFDASHPIWISQMLKAREPETLSFWQAGYCLFGLHLLSATEGRSFHSKNIPHEEERRARTFLEERDLTSVLSPNKSVALVESERSAVILSELFPQFVWLAYIDDLCFTIDMLKPLKGRKVVLYPRTDNTCSTYLFWHDIADMARKCYHLDVTVSSFLEDHATAQQKEKNIDLIDYLYESNEQTETGR